MPNESQQPPSDSSARFACRSGYRRLRSAGLVVSFWLGLCVLAGGCRDDGGPEDSAEPSRVVPHGELRSVALPAPDVVVVLARTGEIYRSADAGRRWRRARVPAVDGLERLVFADAEHAWAIGPAVVLTSEDGGRRWRRVRLPPGVGARRLRDLATIDARRVILVGEAGLRLRTADGGASWQDVSQGPTVSGAPAPDQHAIVCAKHERGTCWSAGRTIYETTDAGVRWRAVSVADPVGLAPITFETGRVAIDPDAAASLRAAARGLAYRDELVWQLEAFVSEREIEDVARERDPSALFDLIEARTEELRLLLESEGVAPDRIDVVATPPWSYEEFLDDDPKDLERYWRARSAARAAVRIRVHPTLAVTAMAAGRERVWAVGRGGRVLRSGPERIWAVAGRTSSHDLQGVATGGAGGLFAVGQQGALWRSRDAGRSWTAWAPSETGGFFETLRSVAFAPQGERGWVVGDRGRMLRSADGGRVWQVVGGDGAGSSQAARLSFR